VELGEGWAWGELRERGAEASRVKKK
jgi:hypothetical protein